MSKNAFLWASGIRTRSGTLSFTSRTLSAYALYMLFTELNDLYAAKAASISSLEYIIGEFLPVPFLSPFTLCSLFSSWRSEGLCPKDFSHLQTSRWLILSEAGARLFSAASAPSVAASMSRFFSSKSSIFIFMATLFFSVSHIRNLSRQSPGLNRAVPLPSQTEERSLRSAPLRQVWRPALLPCLFHTKFYTLLFSYLFVLYCYQSPLYLLFA